MIFHSVLTEQVILILSEVLIISNRVGKNKVGLYKMGMHILMVTGRQQKIRQLSLTE